MVQMTLGKRVMPRHLNAMGTLHGGVLMKWMDELGADTATNHAERYCVTKHVDSFDFKRSALSGELLILEARVTRVWATSIEVALHARVRGADAEATHLIASAFYVYVALDEERKPTKVFEFVPVGEEALRMWNEAEQRRERRLAAKKKI